MSRLSPWRASNFFPNHQLSWHSWAKGVLPQAVWSAILVATRALQSLQASAYHAQPLLSITHTIDYRSKDFHLNLWVDWRQVGKLCAWCCSNSSAWPVLHCSHWRSILSRCSCLTRALEPLGRWMRLSCCRSIGHVTQVSVQCLSPDCHLIQRWTVLPTLSRLFSISASWSDLAAVGVALQMTLLDGVAMASLCSRCIMPLGGIMRIGEGGHPEFNLQTNTLAAFISLKMTRNPSFQTRLIWL